MDLFADQHRRHRARVAPLAMRMRPRTLDEFVGQEHFIGDGKLLRRLLLTDRLTSAVFYGPSGTGKTTLAHIIASASDAHFEALDAAAAGVREVRAILEAARARLETSGTRTVLFVDELHRFNRAQQDVLLTDVEQGVVILIGATTENPFFAVNAPLISRSQIFQFEPLSADHVKTLLDRALDDRERGFGALSVELTSEARDHLALMSGGDARRALTALEVAVMSQYRPDAASARIVVDVGVAADSIQRRAIAYDGTGDAHYDAISALIKSVRGSDPDAAVYWMAWMLEAGEDPRFIARRLVILAAEDVGTADSQALVLAQAAADATVFVGLPECQLPLAQAAIYLACAPKSNASAQAIWRAVKDVRQAPTRSVPKHLRDTHYSGAARLGAGKGYQYPHRDSRGVVPQDHLGVDQRYYVPTDRGDEARLAERLRRLRAVQRSRPATDDAGGSGSCSNP